jgi:hypothetical protein
VENGQKLPKKSGEIPLGILSISGAFLSDTVTFPPHFGRFRSFSEAEIIDLGNERIHQGTV